ncbi:trypsin-like peptidase domain-containing protein, partial [Clostridium haemolyticum]|uniref:trypsin-like peptidase domain-containing protein n=1 Tax=Clostridium haemolyticum TaxID=84025 RepID=UPI0030B81A1B
MSATLIGKDDIYDIAVIKINAKSLPAAKFADSSEVNVGDTAIAIGNPLGEA